MKEQDIRRNSRDRRSFRHACDVVLLSIAIIAMQNSAQALNHEAVPRVQREPGRITVSSDAFRVSCSLKTGLWDAAWNGSGAASVRSVNSSSRLEDGRQLAAAGYPSHECGAADIGPVSDRFGHGIRLTIHHRAPGLPELRQQFLIYAKLPYFLTSVIIVAPSKTASNDIAVIACDSAHDPAAGVHLDAGDIPQTLSVPYDNDSFVRYDSSGRHTSYEVTAIYDNASRHGIVIGSVSHDIWKTGITFGNVAPRTVGTLRVYGGMADTQTRDTQPHGFVAGTEIRSPEMFVGSFTDWRTGLETFGHANALVHPPLHWSEGVPFGWNSWAAFQTKIDYAHYIGVSDFIKRSLQTDNYSSSGVVYVNLDAFWDRFTEAQIEDAVRHVHANGQKAGIYWTPFVYWGGNADKFVDGTDHKFRYTDALLKDTSGNPLPPLDNGRALDPSHPATLQQIDWQLHQFVRWGFDYVKLDFLTHGSLEGAHFDPHVTTGTEAYNMGMRRIVDDLSPQRIGRPFFISESIAPVFPGGYAHSRRISCDTWGELANSEYMLNSLTYGWWLQGSLYPYNDPDHVVLYQHPPGTEDVARTRLNASVIAGTVLINSDDLTLPQAQARAAELLTNPEIDALARMGCAFRPVEGNTADKAADVFLCAGPRSRVIYVAVFNFNPAVAVTKTLDLKRLGLQAAENYKVHDLWTHTDTIASKTLSVNLPPARSTILRLTETR